MTIGTTHVSPQLREFVDAAFAAAATARAADAAQASTQVLDVANRRIDVRFCGARIAARFLPTLHTSTVTGEPDLTIDCWDGIAAEIPLPPPPWRPRDFLDDRIRGATHGAVVAYYNRWSRMLTLYDRDLRRGLVHVADADDLLDWHDRAPFRRLFALWADDHGLALLHGSAVARDGRGVVFAGISGSGKSTTAMTCALAGLDFLADDACLVEPVTGRLHSLYRRAKLTADATDRLGERIAGSALGALEPTDEGAAVVSPHAVGQQAEARAILLVSIGRQAAAELSDPLPAPVALSALIASVRVENDGVTAEAVQALSDVVSRVRVRHLVVGSDERSIVDTVEQVLAG